MEQKDLEKLDELAAQAGSFDDFLASVEKASCDKPADAAENSSSTPSSSEVGTSAEGKSSAALDVSEADVRKAWANKPTYIQDGLKTESLAHPTAPNVTAESAAISSLPPESPNYETKLEIKEHPIVGQYLSETQVKTEKADWWAETFLGGKKRAADMASLEAVIDWIHQMDEAIAKIKATQQGARSHVEDALKGMSSKRRSEVAKHDRSYRSPKTVDENGEPKAKRPSASKPSTSGKSKGMKTADALVTGMGYTYQEVIDKLQATNLLDDETRAYVDRTYKG